MSQFDPNSDCSSDNQDEIIIREPARCAVSILKHLPEARKIMEGHNYEHQITKCVYQLPLASNPAFVAPTLSNSHNLQLPHNRLVRIEDVLFQHEHMKQKIRTILGKAVTSAGDPLATLWGTYSALAPSYARFGLNARKSNFANVMMPINGVNISLGTNKPMENGARLLQDSVRFDSHFESGNLLYAYRNQSTDTQAYDLILQNDTNTRGHNQWFYFKVHNSKKHNRIRFNIVNFIKDESMFSYGLKPLVFSERDFSRHKVGWVRDGEKVAYFENKLRRECNEKSYYTLSFQYYFREVDTVYFAPVHPYTYTQLTEYFNNLVAEYSLAQFVSIKAVTETVGRNSISVVTLGTGRKPIKECSVAWVIARQHPGETTSSFMAQGIINYLVSLYSSPAPECATVLDNFIFKIVPMVNVDGVVHGNTRAQLTGVDPNRMWKKTMKRLCPNVSTIKKLIAQNKENVKLVLDLHSHSKKTGCFFYGNSLLHDPKSTKIYPTLVCDGDPRFQLKHCRFRGGYETTARSVLFYDLGIPQVYTVECSLLGYLKKNRITEYKVSDYYQMGKRLMEKYIYLQKIRITKEEKWLVEQVSAKMVDKEDAQSARSESSLSDEQYDEIQKKGKQKPKKKKVRKSENEANTLVIQEQKDASDQLKYFMRKNGKGNGRVELSTNEKKKMCHSRELSTNQLKGRYNILNIKNCVGRQGKENVAKKASQFLAKEGLIPKLRRWGQREQAEQKKGGTLSRTKVGREIAGMREGREEKSEVLRKEVEVQASMTADSRYLESRRALKNRSENSLCVVGSSLEEDLVLVGKNEVGIQSYQELIEQSVVAEGNKRSVKIKKAPRILNYLCSNLIGSQHENWVLPQDRRLASLHQNKGPSSKV